MLDDFTSARAPHASESTSGAHHPPAEAITGPTNGSADSSANRSHDGSVDRSAGPPESAGRSTEGPTAPDAVSAHQPQPQRWFDSPPRPAAASPSAEPAMLAATDHRRQPIPAGSPEPTLGQSGPRRAGRSRFGVGVIVGALATGAFAVGGVTGAALVRPQASTTPVATATPVALDSTAASAGSINELVTSARPSIVAIHTTITAADAFGQVAMGEAAGTGWVLSADGYIVTNNHVVADSTSIEVSLSDGSTLDATLVGADERSDLAVLHVDRTDLTPLPIGDSDAIRVGDGVVAIGNALDLGSEPTVTGGIVSAKERSITEETGAPLVHLIQTDAAISHGNSGGPLLDMAGRVIGINTAVAGQGQNIGFAISINSAIDFIDELRGGNAPSHPLLGVNSQMATDGTPGAVITDVGAGTAAAAAGIQPGDIITAIDGDEVSNPEDLGAAIARHKVGDSITITATRNGAEVTLTGILGARDTADS